MIGDIASELADHCIQVYVSTSNGAVVVPRICAGGSLTIENSTMRIADYIPHVIKNAIRKKGVDKVANTIYSMKALHLNADDAVSSVIVNDEIGIRISSGKVKVRTGIEKINGKAIYFKDGKIENDIDAIILCTGYKRSFSFFKQDDIQIEKNGKYIPLYKGIFTSKYGSSLAFIGMASQFAPFAITAEMQVRYAAEVFKKRIILPNKQKMEECIQAVEMEVEAAAGRNLKEYNFVSIIFLYSFSHDKILVGWHYRSCFYFHHSQHFHHHDVFILSQEKTPWCEPSLVAREISVTSCFQW